MDIADTEKAIRNVARQQRADANKLRNKDLKIENLSAELAQQRLAIQAITRFLVHKEIVSEIELDEFIEAVDAEDGVIDGKMTITPD